MDHHVSFMKRAISCGRLSLPLAGVNPAVGALLVKDGVILGRGFHAGPGTAHAEIAAINQAITQSGDPDVAQGASLYCTLEPCCQHGPGKRTPPCTEAIVKAGIVQVYCACSDPNPLVSGAGIAALRQAGVAVQSGLLEREAAVLIEAFRVSIIQRRPFVRLKWAQSLDGQIALASGLSRWITPPSARREAHQLRAAHDAVLIGMGTLLADDPELTVRHCPGHQSLRVLLAGRGGLPAGRRFYSAELGTDCLVITTAESSAALFCKAQKIPFICVAPDPVGRPDLGAALAALYQRGIGSLLVEGGAGILGALVQAGLWDALTIFQAPILLGQGVNALAAFGVDELAAAPHLTDPILTRGDGFFRIDGNRQAIREEASCSLA